MFVLCIIVNDLCVCNNGSNVRMHIVCVLGLCRPRISEANTLRLGHKWVIVVARIFAAWVHSIWPLILTTIFVVSILTMQNTPKTP